MAPQPYFPLSNGVKIPGLGFGTFANNGKPGESYNAVMCALKTGYRHMDCAWFYQNESEVGDAIHDFLRENPNVKREDLFVTTKVWNHMHEPEDVHWSFNNSLEKLRLDYVDLFLVHWPIASEKTNEDPPMPKLGADGKYVIKKELTEHPQPTWKAMEEIYESGRTRAIGVSNWTEKLLDYMLSWCKVAPHVNEVEVHPFLPNDHLIKYCQDKNIMIMAYSPLGSQDQVPTTGEKVNTNPTLNKIAEEGGYTLAQVLIAWGLRRGYVVLPKSGNPGRIASNFNLIDLTDAQFEAVNAVARGRHFRFVNMKDTFGYDVWPEESAGQGTN